MKTILAVILSAISIQASTLSLYLDGRNEATKWDSGGGFYKFNGDRQVKLNLAPVNGAWTVCAWVRKHADDRSGALITDDVQGIKLSQVNAGRRDGNVGLTLFGVKDHAFSYKLPVNQWVFLSFVYDGNHVSLYVDAILRSRLYVRMQAPRARVGGRIWNGKLHDSAHADIDDLSVWKGALPQSLLEDLWISTPSMIE